MLPEIGEKGQKKLLEAKVLVIGAGGLGCPVLQYLCAAGTGTLGIVDFDTVDESNLQRQILFGSSSLGQNKAMAAKRRLEDLNETIAIHAYPEKLEHGTAVELFRQHDLIVDCTDNFASRYLISDAAVIAGKPTVYGAIYKFEGQVSVFNYKNGPSYRCLFPAPPPAGSIPDCSETGVLGVLPGIIGSMQASEALKIILGIGQVLSGKVYCFNALTLQSRTFAFPKSEFAKAEKIINDGLYAPLPAYCDDSVPTLPLKKALEMERVQFVDVREIHEEPKTPITNCVSVPLSDWNSQLKKIDRSKNIVLFCQSGARSRKATKLLQAMQITNCFSLKEGAQEITAFFNNQFL